MLKYVGRSNELARKIGIISDTHDHGEEHTKDNEAIMSNNYKGGG
jgi:hypothetical protein